MLPPKINLIKGYVSDLCRSSNECLVRKLETWSLLCVLPLVHCCSVHCFFVSPGTWWAEFNQGTWPVSLSPKNLAVTALCTRICPAPCFAPLALVELFSLAPNKHLTRTLSHAPMGDLLTLTFRHLILSLDHLFFLINIVIRGCIKIVSVHLSSWLMSQVMTQLKAL